jgi:hypothetical protein
VVGRRQLFYAVLAAGAIQLIGFGTNYAVALATGDKGSPTLLIVAGVVSVIGGSLTLLLQNVMNPRPVTTPAPTPSSPTVQQRASNGGRGRLSLIVALILMIVLCGVGGTAATSFATAVIDKLNAFPDPFKTPGPDKNDPFKPVLAHEASARSDALTVKVTQAEANSKDIRLTVTAINSGDESMTLPLFKNCQLSVPGSATLEADPNSQWPITVPAHGDITGVIVFHGKYQPGTGRLTFATIFRMRGGSISVEIPFATAS